MSALRPGEDAALSRAAHHTCLGGGCTAPTAQVLICALLPLHTVHVEQMQHQALLQQPLQQAAARLIEPAALQLTLCHQAGGAGTLSSAHNRRHASAAGSKHAVPASTSAHPATACSTSARHDCCADAQPAVAMCWAQTLPMHDQCPHLTTM